MPTSETSRWRISASEYPQRARNIQFYRDTANAVIRSAQLTTGAEIADVGCGSSGLVIDTLLRNCPDFSRLYCVDISPEMIGVLSSRYDDKRIEYIVAPAESASTVITRKLDAVVSNAAVWLFDVDASFCELRKLLKPGGRFAFNIAEWDLALDGLHNAVRYDLIDTQLAKLNLPSKPSRGSPTKLTAEAINAFARKAGFRLAAFERNVSIMTLDDWRQFYSIRAIAMRSLPHLSVDVACQVLVAAMEEFSNYHSVDEVRWANFVLVAD